jgi:hypothetical protein
MLLLILGVVSGVSEVCPALACASHTSGILINYASSSIADMSRSSLVAIHCQTKHLVANVKKSKSLLEIASQAVGWEAHPIWPGPHTSPPQLVAMVVCGWGNCVPQARVGCSPFAFRGPGMTPLAGVCCAGTSLKRYI